MIDFVKVKVVSKAKHGGGPKPIPPDFDLGYALGDVVRLFYRTFDHRMKPIGLTRATWRVLAHLSRKDGQTQAELADELDTTRVSVGWLVDRLEKMGHIERRAVASDRRVWRVYLTKRAGSDIQSMTKLAHEFCDDVFGYLSQDEFDALKDVLAKLRQRLGDIGSPDANGVE